MQKLNNLIIHKEVCFVCTANMCRSAMAEAIFNNLSSKFEAVSCGLKTISGYPATSDSQKACKKNGLSLKNHTTQKANSILLQNRIVIGMTKAHLNKIKMLCPDSECYLLTELGSGSGKDILDPVKKGFKSHLDTFSLLKKEIICFLGNLESMEKMQ